MLVSGNWREEKMGRMVAAKWEMARQMAIIGVVRIGERIGDPAVREIDQKSSSAHDVRSGQPFLIGKVGAEGGI
jgi:hypothetical protein